MQKNVLKKLFISHKFDFLLGAVLLIVALCLFVIFKTTRKNGSYVCIKQGKNVVGTYALDEDSEYEIKSF